METNAQLVQYLLDCQVLKSKELKEAFDKVDRADFVIPDYLESAYDDTALPIGLGQTISQPWVVAFMLELLEIEDGNRVLDIGAGSGYTTALLSKLVGEKGKVIAVEIVPELADQLEVRVEKLGLKNVKAICGDGQKILKASGQFDRILVSAAAKKISKDLTNALKKKRSVGYSSFFN